MSEKINAGIAAGHRLSVQLFEGQRILARDDVRDLLDAFTEVYQTTQAAGSVTGEMLNMYGEAMEKLEVTDLRKALIDCIHVIERLDKVVPGGLDTAERETLRKAIVMWERES